MAKRLSKADSDRRLPLSESALLAWVMAGSLLCHIAVLALLIWVAVPRMQRLILPGAINVNLVSLSPPAPARGAKKEHRKPVERKRAEKRAVKVSSEKPVEETHRERKEAIKKVVKRIKEKPMPKKPAPVEKKIAVAPKLKELKPLPKKHTLPPPDTVKRAIERIEKNVERSRPRSNSLQEALTKLKQEVAKAPDENRVRNRSPNVHDETGSGGGGGAAGSVELINIYRVEIAHQVESNWAYASQLGDGGSAQQVSIVFKVNPNGEIYDIFFTQRSANHYLDDSALIAIEKSNPLPPFPAGLVRPYVEVGLRFSPQGVQ